MQPGLDRQEQHREHCLQATSEEPGSLYSRLNLQTDLNLHGSSTASKMLKLIKYKNK